MIVRVHRSLIPSLYHSHCHVTNICLATIINNGVLLIAPVTPADAAALPPSSSLSSTTIPSLSQAIANDIILQREYKSLAAATNDPSGGVRAVMVFSDPRDWYRDIQVIVDVLTGAIHPSTPQTLRLVTP
jgi:pectin methylesterase-like acyl-CoA thioesterase